MYFFKEFALIVLCLIVPFIVVESELVAKNGVIKQPMTVVEELVVEEHNHMQKREIPDGSGDKKESAIDRLPAAVQEEGPPARETSVLIQDAPKKSYASIVGSIQFKVKLPNPRL